YLGIFGRLFILLLTLVIIPLIFVSVLNGTAGIGDPRRLGGLGMKCLFFYLCTTALAVITGLTVVNTIEPGRGRESLRATVEPAETRESVGAESLPAIANALILIGLVEPEEGRAFIREHEARREEESAQAVSLGRRIQEQILPAVIRNPIMADQNPIVIIFFAIVLGAALAALGSEGLPALRVFQSLDKALITIILWVMHLAPIGVFALMARAISELGIEYMLTLAKYFVTVMLGLGIHFCVLSFVLCPLLARISPMRFLRGMAPAFQLAFSTSSSSATLPVTIECAIKRVGADTNISSFMLPVGATINMDGTALYLSVASLFVAQVYGMELSLQAQFMVFLTAVLASVGTAGIPGASIGLMGIIFTSVGIPVEGIAIVIGVDRLLDMTRTVVNITGDSLGAVVISRSEGKLAVESGRDG
ncbi:MAG TPA: dicarboxylate/amino acid:cation symporter, partial [Candidatus Hydrogenedentes bacterium]|nr:dicarboxylate/amino acid:cation symporter [Candidatus Hydrogenedentota bacterium]